MSRLLILFALLLGGCASTQYVATAKPFGRAIKPVCISKQDQMTEGTAQQLEANNLALTKIYGSKPACKASKPTS